MLTNVRVAARADLKSVLSLIAAGISFGDCCAVRIDGVDEDAAGSTLRRFIEQELPKLDKPVALAPRTGALPTSFDVAGVEASADTGAFWDSSLERRRARHSCDNEHDRDSARWCGRCRGSR